MGNARRASEQRMDRRQSAVTGVRRTSRSQGMSVDRGPATHDPARQGRASNLAPEKRYHGCPAASSDANNAILGGRQFIRKPPAIPASWIEIDARDPRWCSVRDRRNRRWRQDRLERGSHLMGVGQSVGKDLKISQLPREVIRTPSPPHIPAAFSTFRPSSNILASFRRLGRIGRPWPQERNSSG